MAIQAETNKYRTTARIVGVIYLAGFVVGFMGDARIQSVLGVPNYLSAVSVNSMTLLIGAVLWLMAVIGDAAHGVLMFPILKQHNERIAVGYLAARILDAAFIAIMVIFVLLQIPLGSEYVKAVAPNSLFLESVGNVIKQAQIYAYSLGMSTLGVSGVLLCYTLYRAKLVPRLVAIWGLVGYAIIFVGMLTDILGSGLGLASSIPGGLWEMFVGVWLIVKGFNAFAIAPASVKTDANVNDALSLGKA